MSYNPYYTVLIIPRQSIYLGTVTFQMTSRVQAVNRGLPAGSNLVHDFEVLLICQIHDGSHYDFDLEDCSQIINNL